MENLDRVALIFVVFDRVANWHGLETLICFKVFFFFKIENDFDQPSQNYKAII